MNRLTNYFKAKEIAKMELMTAEKLSMSDLNRSLRHLIAAVKEILTAQNCLVSLAFESRVKIKKRK